MPTRAKVEVLRALLTDGQVEDIDLEPPTLESLYAHFDGTVRRNTAVEEVTMSANVGPEGVTV